MTCLLFEDGHAPVVFQIQCLTQIMMVSPWTCIEFSECNYNITIPLHCLRDIMFHILMLHMFKNRSGVSDFEKAIIEKFDRK